MSDLLRKKNKLLERGAPIVPERVFTMDDLNTVSKDPVEEKKPAKKNTRTTAEKTTTVRVSAATKNKLNAMVTVGIADTVDQLTDVLIDEYISNILSKEEKKQLNIVLDLYKTKKPNK